MFRTVLLLFFCFTLLAACGTTPRKDSGSPEAQQAYQDRFDHLQQRHTWSLSGRLAIADGKDGGSGRLSWAQKGSESQLEFRGTMGKGAWKLNADATGARIKLANGEVHTADSVNQLVMNQLGWRVPVDSMTWWVKGLAQPDAWDNRELDENGLLIRVQQSGWAVEFSKYKQHEGFWMPSSLTARRDQYSVKMVIKHWELPSNGEHIE